MKCNRRDFMKGMAACMGAGLMGSALGKDAGRFHNVPGTNVRYSAGGRAAGAGGNIVVFVQMFGGNDGLNTVYPLDGTQRALYEQYRPTLKMPNLAADFQPWVTAGIGGNSALDIGANADGMTYALNPGMGALHDLYSSGKVAVLPGVHYPNPNHSHFESTNIYNSANPNSADNQGWFGKYLKNAGFTNADVPTVVMGYDQSPLFTPSVPSVFTFDYLDSLQFPANDDPVLKAKIFNDFCDLASLRDPSLYPELVKIAQTARATTTHLTDYYQINDGSPNYVPGKVQALLVDDNGNYSRDNPLVYTSQLNEKVNPKIADMDLAKDLKHVAAVIRADVGARFFHVSIGGFDTHSEQETDLYHSRILNQISESLAAFYSDMNSAVTLPGGLTGYQTGNLSNKVVIVSFSEFGRTIRQNAPGINKAGTDHASSAPQFVIGGQVLGGQYGNYPALDNPGFEAEDDLKMTTDFRDVFGTILNKWLNVPTADIGPGPGKILTPTPDKDGDGNDYVAFTPLGFLP